MRLDLYQLSVLTRQAFGKLWIIFGEAASVGQRLLGLRIPAGSRQAGNEQKSVVLIGRLQAHCFTRLPGRQCEITHGVGFVARIGSCKRKSDRRIDGL